MENPLKLIMDFMGKGGFFMWPLLLCSIFAFAIVTERLMALRKLDIDGDWLIQQIALFLQDRKIAETVEYLRQLPGVLPKVMEVGLIRFDKDRDEIEGALINAIYEQTPVLERYVSSLGTIAVVAPFLGLLGTITGMISAFTQIALKGTTGPAVIASGIYEALYTTAAGLIIAIPTVIFYNYIRAKIKVMLTQMEVCSNKLVEMIVLARKGEPFPEDLLPEGYKPKIA